MALSKKYTFLLQEVLSKVKYDTLLETYAIHLIDYAFLDLDLSQMQLLRKICASNNIYLEELPKGLNSAETQTLILKYKETQRKLNNSPSEEIETLNSILDELRNQIVLGNMWLIFKVINKFYPELKDINDKEDIYQIGYLKLIEFVDKYDESKGASFVYYIRCYIIHHIVRESAETQSNINQYDFNDMKKIIAARVSLSSRKEKITPEKLAEETGLSKTRVKNLLELEKFIHQESLDEDREELPQDLIENDFEERIIENIINESNYLEKLIDTLTPQQRIVMRLYFGFEGKSRYTQEEIANILGISDSRSNQIIIKGLKNLTSWIRGEYIKDATGQIIPQKNHKPLYPPSPISKKLLEDTIIESISPEILDRLLVSLSPITRNVITLYYGLNGNNKHSTKEISQLLNISIGKIPTIRDSGVKKILRLYSEKQNPQYQGDYLNFAMSKHLNKTRKKA